MTTPTLMNARVIIAQSLDEIGSYEWGAGAILLGFTQNDFEHALAVPLASESDQLVVATVTHECIHHAQACLSPHLLHWSSTRFLLSGKLIMEAREFGIGDKLDAVLGAFSQVDDWVSPQLVAASRQHIAWYARQDPATGLSVESLVESAAFMGEMLTSTGVAESVDDFMTRFERDVPDARYREVFDLARYFLGDSTAIQATQALVWLALMDADPVGQLRELLDRLAMTKETERWPRIKAMLASLDADALRDRVAKELGVAGSPFPLVAQSDALWRAVANGSVSLASVFSDASALLAAVLDHAGVYVIQVADKDGKVPFRKLGSEVPPRERELYSVMMLAAAGRVVQRLARQGDPPRKPLGVSVWTSQLGAPVQRRLTRDVLKCRDPVAWCTEVASLLDLDDPVVRPSALQQIGRLRLSVDLLPLEGEAVDDPTFRAALAHLEEQIPYICAFWDPSPGAGMAWVWLAGRLPLDARVDGAVDLQSSEVIELVERGRASVEAVGRRIGLDFRIPATQWLAGMGGQVGWSSGCADGPSA